MYESENHEILLYTWFHFVFIQIRWHMLKSRCQAVHVPKSVSLSAQQSYVV